jgi:hypothetical protein
VQHDRLVAIRIRLPDFAVLAIDEVRPELAGDAIREAAALARQDDGMACPQGADIGENRIQAVGDLDGDQGACSPEAARRFIRSCSKLGEADLSSVRRDDRNRGIESLDALK